MAKDKMANNDNVNNGNVDICHNKRKNLPQ